MNELEHAARVKSRRGFTLLEISLTIAVMLVLAAIGLAITRTVLDSGHRSKAVQEMHRIRDLLDEYRLRHGAYPNRMDGANGVPATNLIPDLSAWLIPTGTNVPAATRITAQANATELMTDPWGNGYTYFYTTNQPFLFLLRSNGPKPHREDKRLEIGP